MMDTWSATTAKRVRAALLEAIARKLGSSKRTLQRRVEAEGRSYRDPEGNARGSGTALS
jgi:hypothetical protein